MFEYGGDCKAWVEGEGEGMVTQTGRSYIKFFFFIVVMVEVVV